MDTGQVKERKKLVSLYNFFILITGRIYSILSCGLYSFCVLYMPYINVCVADIITHILEGNTILYVQHQGKEYAINMIYMWPDSTILLPGGGKGAESIYRVLGFLAIVWFGSSPITSPPFFFQQARPATYRKTEKERQLADGRGGGEWEETKSYDDEKAWLSIIDTLWMGGGMGE